MGLRFYKRIKIGKKTSLNLSKRGASISTKIDPITYNSKGYLTISLLRGISYSVNLKKIKRFFS